MTTKKNTTINISIRNTVFISSMLTGIMLILFSYILISSKQYNSVVSNASNTLSKAEGIISIEVDSYLKNSISLSTNREFIRLLSKKNITTTEQKMQLTTDLSYFIELLETYFTPSSSSYLIYTDSTSIYKNKYFMDINQLDKTMEYKLSQADYSTIVWDSDPEHFIFYKKIKATGEYKYILRTQIPQDIIDKYIESFDNDNFYICLGTASPPTKRIAASAQLANGSILYSVVHENVKSRIYLTNFFAAILIMLFISVLLYIVSMSTSAKITHDLDEFINYLNNDEFLLMNVNDKSLPNYKEFDMIKQKIVALLHTTKRLYTRISDSEKKRTKLELELLQSKFNPHLLYNTLSTIKWKIMRKNITDIAPAIDQLTRYYKNVLTQENIAIPISEEIQILRQYINIMEFSQSQKYRLNIDISQNIMEYKIIRLTFQPFVENAILHGLNQKDDAVITILGYMEGDKIIIKIKDNGYGIPADKLESIRNGKYTSIYRSYGIKNTKKRLEMYLGKENFDLDIDSLLGEGTIITLSYSPLDDVK